VEVNAGDFPIMANLKTLILDDCRIMNIEKGSMNVLIGKNVSLMATRHGREGN